MAEPPALLTPEQGIAAEDTAPHPNPIPTAPQTQPYPTPIPTQFAGANASKRLGSQQATQTAPIRDFNRRANSLERDALPARLFPGASKSLYDALYVKTRGAVLATRKLQATKRQLMEW